MTLRLRPDLDTIERSILMAFPPLSGAAQRTGLALYRLLLETRPIDPHHLAAVMGMPAAEIVALLDEPGMRCQLLYDDSSSVIGFGGLTIASTVHRLTVDNRQMFTWCAWDSLFIPGLLGATSARAESTCPVSSDLVCLTVTLNGVLPLAAREPVLSFTLPDVNECSQSAERSITRFCQHLRLFASYDAGSTWAAERNDVFLLSLDDAFTLGQRYNAARFGHGASRVAPASERAGSPST
jgi:alkylmercury lyase